MILEIDYLQKLGSSEKDDKYGVFIKTENDCMEFWFSNKHQRDAFYAVLERCISVVVY